MWPRPSIVKNYILLQFHIKVQEGGYWISSLSKIFWSWRGVCECWELWLKTEFSYKENIFSLTQNRKLFLWHNWSGYVKVKELWHFSHNIFIWQHSWGAKYQNYRLHIKFDGGSIRNDYILLVNVLKIVLSPFFFSTF